MIFQFFGVYELTEYYCVCTPSTDLVVIERTDGELTSSNPRMNILVTRQRSSLSSNC